MSTTAKTDELSGLIDFFRFIETTEPYLSTRQLLVLAIIGRAARDETLGVVGISAAAGNMPMPAISRAVDSLAEIDFVERTRNMGDTRRVIVSLRPAGRSFLKKLAEAFWGE